MNISITITNDIEFDKEQKILKDFADLLASYGVRNFMTYESRLYIYDDKSNKHFIIDD